MITIKQGDITQEDTDAIVNAANTGLKGGGGVDGAIHRAAGPSVMEECKNYKGCPTGQAVMTGAGSLKAQKIIHTAGPVWHGGRKGEAELLESCYRSCFKLAKGENLKTISFPAISTGVYRYPKPEATRIALKTAQEYEEDFQEIRFICFSSEGRELYERIYQSLK